MTQQDRDVTRILFVCHGNICRSTMAQCIMQNLVDEADIGNEFVIDSAATTTEELGMPIYPPAKEALAAHGIATVPHKARKIKSDEGDNWDLIVCMDEENVRHLRQILDADSMGKVRKLLSFIGEDGDVADPWYTRDFETTFEEVLAGCEALLEYVVD